MLQSILSGLFGGQEDRDDEMDTRLAVVALLVHMMAVDGEASEEETRALRDLVKRNYATSDAETERLIARAREEDARAIDLYGFTRVLKNELSEADRVRIVELLWDMVYADGEVHEFEDNLVWRVSELLAVDPKDRIAMKQKARGNQLIGGSDNGGDEE